MTPLPAIEPITLRGRRVLLEPLAAAHLPGLAAALADGELWRIPVTLVPHPDELPAFFETAQTRLRAQRELAFATIDIESQATVGSTRFMNIDRDNRRVEIGFTFIARAWQRSHINTEAKLLMLNHAFDTWQCNRVELITDVLNDKSRNAIRRIGAQEEGILRSHMIMRDGRLRDSVVYSIVRSEWPDVKASLTRRVAGN